MRLTKQITRDIFTFEISETLCGSLAYVLYCNNEQILKNNNYFPTEKAVVDEPTMLKELISIVVKEKSVGLIPETEKKFLESEDFIKLKKMIDA